jgi:hypothetical protein
VAVLDDVAKMMLGAAADFDVFLLDKNEDTEQMCTGQVSWDHVGA